MQCTLLSLHYAVKYKTQYNVQIVSAAMFVRPADNFKQSRIQPFKGVLLSVISSDHPCEDGYVLPTIP